MPKKRDPRKWILGVFIVAVITVAMFILFTPKPIIDTKDTWEVYSVSYNRLYPNDFEEVYIEDFDEAEILECISKYSERRLFTDKGIGYLTNIHVKIKLYNQDMESEFIELGHRADHVIHSNGKKTHAVEDADAMRAELVSILKIE